MVAQHNRFVQTTPVNKERLLLSHGSDGEKLSPVYLPADRCKYLFRTLLWSTVQSCNQFHNNDLCIRRRKRIGWGLCIVLRSRKASCKQALGRTRRSNRTCRRTCLPCTFHHSCTAKGKTHLRSCYLQKKPTPHYDNKYPTFYIRTHNLQIVSTYYVDKYLLRTRC